MFEVQFCGTPLGVLEVSRLVAFYKRINCSISASKSNHYVRRLLVTDEACPMCAKAVRSAELRTIPSSEAVQLLRAACPTAGAGGSTLAPGGGEAGAAADVATTTTELDPDAAK